MATQLQKFLARLLRKNKISVQDQLIFLQRLHRLTESGYPLHRALEAVQWDVKLSPHIRIISASLHKGMAIDQALEHAGFHESITSYFYFARLNGDLAETTRQCSQMMQRQIKYMKKFQQTARYPALLLCLVTVLLFFVKNSVYPSFEALFVSAGQTSQVTSFSIFFINLLFHLFIFAFFAALLLLSGWSFLKSRISIDIQIKYYLKLPIYREYLKLQTTFLFCLHLSSLLKTGMPLKDSLRTLHTQKHLAILGYYAKRMETELEKGVHVAHIISTLPLFATGMDDIFQQNVNIKDLQKDLSMYAEFLINQIENKVKKAISLFQPVIFVLLASLIIFMYLSLMLPMFQLIDTI